MEKKIKALIYGSPGSGKTTLGCSVKNSVFFDLENGSDWCKHEGKVVKVKSLSDMGIGDDLNFTTFGERIEKYDYVFIDPIASLVEMFADKMGVYTSNDFGATWKKLYDKIIELLNFVSFEKNKNIILFAHEKSIEDGERGLISKPNMTGKVADKIIENVDIVAFQVLAKKDGKKQPLLMVNTDDKRHFCTKDRTGCLEKLFIKSDKGETTNYLPADFDLIIKELKNREKELLGNSVKKN